ncbi:hypothetical protein NKI48_21470 [Mesorhizobium sp. M0644]|uniref:hypothetical protein n=1 Tax=unclassified Mesorhizobium TaxID=325217 RepID=UPI003336A8A4
MTEAVDEAHRNQLYVSAHAIGEAPVRLALEGGIDVIEHGYGISPETRALLVAKGTIVVSTISQLYFHRAAYDAYHYRSGSGRFTSATGRQCSAIFRWVSRPACGTRSVPL